MSFYLSLSGFSDQCYFDENVHIILMGVRNDIQKVEFRFVENRWTKSF